MKDAGTTDYGYSRLSYTPARTVREFRELMDDSDAEIIRTDDDWNRYLESQECPLRTIDRDAVDQFTRALKLNGRGLVAMDYTAIQDKLSFLGFRGMLGRFGLDLRLAADYDGYYCAGKGTCSKQTNSICIGDNC